MVVKYPTSSPTVTISSGANNMEKLTMHKSCA